MQSLPYTCLANWSFTLWCLAFLGIPASQAAPRPVERLQRLGKSDKAAVLEISPDGNWLLSWDGVTLNTPATNPGQRLVWNLKTGKSRDFSTWSADTTIYDDDCGFTTDNRIWNLYGNPEPLAEGNSTYTPIFYIENCDGTGKVVCTDTTPKKGWDTESGFGDDVSFDFSKDGKILYVKTGSYRRTFDTHTGKMLSRHRLRKRRSLSRMDSGGQIMPNAHSQWISEVTSPNKMFRYLLDKNGEIFRKYLGK